MTENKRFTAPDRYRFSHSKIQLNGEPLTNDEIVRVLNVNDGAFVENFNLKKENKELKEENEQLKQQLLCDSDSVCDICKHEYLIPKDNYFIAKCRKGHEECSKEDIKYCGDFEFKGLEEKVKE